MSIKEFTKEHKKEICICAAAAAAGIGAVVLIRKGLTPKFRYFPERPGAIGIIEELPDKVSIEWLSNDNFVRGISFEPDEAIEISKTMETMANAIKEGTTTTEMFL